MNSRAQLIRRLAGDFVERCRRSLSTSGDDAAQYVDRLDRGIAEDIAGDVCATIGVDYQSETPLTPDGKKGQEARANSPWQKRKGINLGGKRPEFDKDKSRM